VKGVLVQDWMSRDPVVISGEVGIGIAHQLMKLNNVRRLPVVDDDDNLIGIITDSDIREARLPDDSGLSVLDAHLRLATVEVRGVMSVSPRTVTPVTKVIEAARLMLNEKIGGLPVVEGSTLVGVITESDIFRMFVSEHERA
jgi:acetoin utilization protein AcuB